MSLTEVNTVIQILIGVFAVVGLVRSAYKGTIKKYFFARLRKAEKAHERVEEVEKTVDSIAERQELQTDVLIAIGEATNGDREFDADEYRELIGKDDPNRFFVESED